MKKVLSLLLALMLCLSLCACGGGNETPNTTDASTETMTPENTNKANTVSKIWGAWESVDESTPYSLNINEDKTATMSAEGTTVSYTWICDEATRVICLVPDLPEEYCQQTFTYFEEDDTLIHDWANAKRATPTTEDTPVEDETTVPTENAIISHPLVQDICCEWYVGSVGSEDAPFHSLIINEDGTCIVDGENATWRIEEVYTDDTSLSIYIYIDGQAWYGIWYNSKTEAATLTKPSADCPIFQPYEAYKK